MKWWALLLISWASAVQADDWLHLGAVPEGYVSVEVQSAVSSSPIMLAGTLNPQTLTLNGQKMNLEPVSDATGLADGFYINGQAQKTSDEIGRFFVRVEDLDSEVTELKVILIHSGVAMGATIALDRVFLEVSFTKTFFMREEELPKGDAFPFVLAGPLRAGFEIEIQNQKVEVQEGRGSVALQLPYGKTTLVARINREGARSRVVNLPVTVKKMLSKSGEPALSLRAQSERCDLEIEGVTNGDATLSLGDENIPIHADGTFKIKPDISQPEGELKFTVIEDSKTHEFIYKYRASQCSESSKSRYSWGAYLTRTSMMAFQDSSLPGEVIIPYSRPLDLKNFGFTLRRRYSKNWSIDIFYFRVDELRGGDDDKNDVTVENAVRFGLGTSFDVSSELQFGMALNRFRADVSGKNFALAATELEGVGLSLYLTGTYKIRRGWVYVPRLEMMSSGLGSFNSEAPGWLDFAVHPVGVRRDF